MLCLAKDKLQEDYNKLKADESNKSAQLAEMSLQMDRREQAKQDLKLLEETVVCTHRCNSFLFLMILYL